MNGSIENVQAIFGTHTACPAPIRWLHRISFSLAHLTLMILKTKRKTKRKKTLRNLKKNKIIRSWIYFCRCCAVICLLGRHYLTWHCESIEMHVFACSIQSSMDDIIDHSKPVSISFSYLLSVPPRRRRSTRFLGNEERAPIETNLFCGSVANVDIMINTMKWLVFVV